MERHARSEHAHAYMLFAIVRNATELDLVQCHLQMIITMHSKPGIYSRLVCNENETGIVGVFRHVYKEKMKQETLALNTV